MVSRPPRTCRAFAHDSGIELGAAILSVSRDRRDRTRDDRDAAAVARFIDSRVSLAGA
jgi:hypothetical protein